MWKQVRKRVRPIVGILFAIGLWGLFAWSARQVVGLVMTAPMDGWRGTLLLMITAILAAYAAIVVMNPPQEKSHAGNGEPTTPGATSNADTDSTQSA